MALFNRNKGGSQDYLSAPDTISRPVPIISALITGLVVAVLVFGLFWAGNWIYNRINSDPSTTASQNQQTNDNKQEQSSESSQNSGNSSSNNANQSENNTSSSSDQNSGSGSASSGRSTNGNSAIPSTGATPTEIPNTGPDPNYNY